MNLKQFTHPLKLKVDSLEQTRKIQQGYIKAQFNYGKNKAIEHKQKITCIELVIMLFATSFVVMTFGNVEVSVMLIGLSLIVFIYDSYQRSKEGKK